MFDPPALESACVTGCVQILYRRELTGVHHVEITVNIPGDALKPPLDPALTSTASRLQLHLKCITIYRAYTP